LPMVTFCMVELIAAPLGHGTDERPVEILVVRSADRDGGGVHTIVPGAAPGRYSSGRPARWVVEHRPGESSAPVQFQP